MTSYGNARGERSRKGAAMKKYCVLMIALIFSLLFTACGCEHEWVEADCEYPRYCLHCSVTSGEPLGHQWSEANCMQAKTCTVCFATEGEPLEHQWQEADCLTPMICSVCGLSEGGALGHDWQKPDCENDGYCARCNLVLTEALGHSYDKWNISGEEMTRRCMNCNYTETVAKDYDLYLHDNLKGTWSMRIHWILHKRNDTDPFFTVNYQYLPENEIHLDQIAIEFLDDNRIIFRMYPISQQDAPVFVLEGTWAFRQDMSTEDVEFYYFYGIFGEEKIILPLALEVTSEEEHLFIYLANATYVQLREEQYMDVMLGRWELMDEGVYQWIEFNQDKTFSTNAFGGISGNWYLSGRSEDGGVFGQFVYQKDGKTYIRPFSRYQGVDLTGAADVINISFEYGYRNLKQEGLDEYVGYFYGTWEATVNGETYYLTVNPDRSFTANINGEISGRWHVVGGVKNGEYASIYLSYQGDDSTRRIECRKNVGTFYEDKTLDVYLDDITLHMNAVVG